MKRGDERALRRAARKLNISPQETLLEFDIGNFLYLILPEDFPSSLPPRAKRVDLVVSDQALYLHCAGIHRRYGWSEILECSFANEFFQWREVNGHKCQVHMFRGFRPLAQVANNCIDDFERNLDPIVNQERAMRRASYDSQDLQRQARNKILGKQNQFKRALGFQGTVTDSDGEILLSSTVVLSPMGVEFVIDEGDRQLILPYELVAIPEIDPISNILTAAVDDPRFQSFTVRGRSEDQISLWKADLDQLIELATT